ncbi:MAG: hypothetical protein K2Y14_01375 [Burkholderiales bacterium]|nr:hypothetical protein [Burkholderiales bacterium]
MKNSIKYLAYFVVTLGVTACGGSGSGGSSSGGGGNTPPVPSTYATSINMGNIATIPLGNGSSGKSTVTLTNNLTDNVILTEATYTLVQNGVTSAAKSASAVGSLIDVSQCSKIAARGGCSIGINPPNETSQAQYVVSMKYVDLTTAKTYLATNVIGFSAEIPQSDTGVRYSSLNNNLYNEPGGSTTLTIPFQLTKTFTSLTASSNNSNPVFAPTISCPGNSYTAGTLCNLYVKVSNTGTNPIVAGGVSVSGETSQVVKTKQSLSKKQTKSLTAALQGTTGYLFGVPITVSQNATGNLVTSAINVVVDPANGTAPETVTLLNNGTATISNISIAGATPVTIASNACSSLAVGISCTFNVNVNSATSGQSTVSVSYSNGAASGNTTGLLTFNVIYISATSTPGLSMTSGQGNLNNVPINTSQFYNILVNNTGAVTLNNLRFTNPSLQNAFFSWGAGSCNTTGTQSLNAGESCTLSLLYAPTAVGSGTLNINAAGNWQDQDGNPQTYAANLGLAYSSITGDAFLYVTPNYVSFAIRADGQDTATQTFNVVNAGLQATTLNVISTAPGVTAFSNLGTGTCSVAQSLAVNESCTINTKYGTTTTTMTNVESQINIGYKPNGNYTNDVFAFANLVFNSSPAAFVEVTDVTLNGATGSYPTYAYVNTPTTPLDVVVTYTNNGTATAANFNVALNNLPVGYKSGTSTCGIGSSVASLAATGSCTVSFSAVDQAGLYNPYNLSGTGLSFNIPGFSYTDTSTGLNTMQFPTWTAANSVSVTTSLFATVTTNAPSSTTATSGGTTAMVFTGDVNGTIITIPATQLIGFTVASPTCTITGGTCSIAIVTPANFPTGTNYFSYYVTPTGLTPAATNSIIQQASFTLTNP